MQMYVAGCLYKSTGLKVAIAGSFIIGSLIVGPFSTMKAICDGFSCVSFVYFAFASICISIFLFFYGREFLKAPLRSLLGQLLIFLQMQSYSKKNCIWI